MVHKEPVTRGIYALSTTAGLGGTRFQEWGHILQGGAHQLLSIFGGNYWDGSSIPVCG